MSFVHERLVYSIGTLVEIVLVPSFSPRLHGMEGKVGIITKAPVLPGTLFEVRIGSEIVWVEQSQMKIIADPS